MYTCTCNSAVHTEMHVYTRICLYKNMYMNVRVNTKCRWGLGLMPDNQEPDPQYMHTSEFDPIRVIYDKTDESSDKSCLSQYVII